MAPDPHPSAPEMQVTPAAFPGRRMRRLRLSPALRALRRETHVSADQLIYPLFVVEDPAAAGPVPSMPGVSRFDMDTLAREAESALSAGIRSVILFGVPRHKDAAATEAHDERGVIPEAIRRLQTFADDLVIITDICLCQYTDHGHCGLLHGRTIDNDETLEVLAKCAVSHAAAGAHLVAPSGMMDGMVGAIRRALDADGFHDIGILSYAAKYASGFYGPFRDAAESAPKFGDRRAYQMDPHNAREALAEVELDLQEGADIVMVKPAMPYLDVIRDVRNRFPSVPLAAYQVSGEYSMIKAACANGWLDEPRVVLESLTGIRRAGADMILTYFAKDAADYLRRGLDC